MIVVDQAKLIKVYGYMGGLSAIPDCNVLNPFSYGNCINVLRNARIELAQIKNQSLDLANKAQTILQDADSTISADVPQKTEIMQAAQANADRAIAVVQEMTGMENKFNQELQTYSWIPGWDTIMLSGLGGLSQEPISTGMTVFYTVAGTVAVISVAYVLGSIATAFKSKYEAAAQQHNSFAQYYGAVKESVTRGVAPPSPPTSFVGASLFGGSEFWPYIAIAAVVGVVFLTRR